MDLYRAAVNGNIVYLYGQLFWSAIIANKSHYFLRFCYASLFMSGMVVIDCVTTGMSSVLFNG